MLMLTAFTASAQDAIFDKHPVKNIPFGKKLPPPDLANHPDNFLPEMISPGKSALKPAMRTYNSNTIKKDPAYFKQLLLDRRKLLPDWRKTQTPAFQNATSNPRREIDNDSDPDFHLLKDINALA